MQLFVILALLTLGTAQDCQLIVPSNPLSAAGLATPYLLLPPCYQGDPQTATFVQGAILDLGTGKFYAYNPLVIDNGTLPLVIPVTPTLPAANVVGLWFGTNAKTLTLVDSEGSLNAGSCVQGLQGSLFGTFAYCNAVAFFAEAFTKIYASNNDLVPPLGTANDGEPCPTIRDFFVVNQMQSDGVVTSYITMGNQSAQDTISNRQNFPYANVIANVANNRLVSISLGDALGCVPMRATDLADSFNTPGIPALPYNEISAAINGLSPVALVPLSDTMTLVNNQFSLAKTNTYRAGVGQNAANNTLEADPIAYCTNIYNIATRRLLKNAANFVNFQSPDPNVASNLFGYLCQRFVTTFGPDGLNCTCISIIFFLIWKIVSEF